MHKKVLEEYQKSGMELSLPTANEENIRVFYEKQKLSQKPIRRSIVKIVRLKEKGQDYFYYGQELTSEDSLGNEIHVYVQPIGRYERPNFDYIIDPNTKARIATSVRATETVNELKWPQDWNADLEKDIDSKVDLLVISANRKYGGFDFTDFKERSLDELVTFGKYGDYKPTPKIIEIENSRRKEVDKAKKVR